MIKLAVVWIVGSDGRWIKCGFCCHLVSLDFALSSLPIQF